MTRESLYQNTIREISCGEDDPRHIEAYMRLQYGTLNHLSRQQVVEEIEICRACIAEGGVERAERCAQSFGL